MHLVCAVAYSRVYQQHFEVIGLKLTEKTISVLGSTGSVGKQTLDVARNQGIPVYGLTGATSVDILEAQIREFSPKRCAVLNERAASDLKVRVADTDCIIDVGSDAICEVAAANENDAVVNSITGVAGLKPSLAVIKAGKELALANKETIVTAGKLVMKAAADNNVPILPVDSEHSAIFQSIGANDRSSIRKIFLTASGGPFFGKKREELNSITPEMALAHPTWKMGPKITIDSATLMNKGFEVIEAVHLFGVSPEKVEVVIHRESIIHSLVEYNDKATLAQLSMPDMRLCVQYALTYPERVESNFAPLDLASIRTLTFASPDMETFTLLPLAYRVAGRPDTTLGATLNGANERAVALFLEGKISFTDIFDIVESVVMNAREMPLTLDNVFEADLDARAEVDCALRR